MMWPPLTIVDRAKRRRAPAGFAMAEVLVAVMILAIIASAFYSALSFGFSVMEGTRKELRAVQILTQRAEAIRLCNWDQLSSFSFSDTYDPLAGPGQSRGTVYVGTVSAGAASDITNPASYKPNMRLVTIDLYWTNYSGGKPIVQNRTFRTHVARFGIENYIWGAQ